jgi:hypothetical protein
MSSSHICEERTFIWDHYVSYDTGTESLQYFTVKLFFLEKILKKFEAEMYEKSSEILIGKSVSHKLLLGKKVLRV